ncbi:hypothetical protein QFC21_006523 [Naganishia friedmannii]|uniref:Uncharacterized protein n=1 Tax=Naganishia friedmannii TaxID=89922 RepID=A0ACC2V3I3_9TREE|nr:hypothetical protein QFC21_006523 [Naganishia friedmannii]
MTTIIKSALLDKYSDDLPVWAYAFMEGIDQLELSKTKDGVSTNTNTPAKRAEVGRMERAVSGSPLTDCGSVDMERESGQAQVAVSEEKEEVAVKPKTFKERAESNFRTAIRLSDGKETLPYTWLAFSLMTSERRSEARETLCEAPLSSPLLLRLTTCYEQEKDYIKAYDTMERALQLTPDDERNPHTEHLKRLAEQARDMKANIFRGDPFEILPLEVVITIMRFGQDMKDDFVLKSSWVNQRWRHTLTQNCPELWRTLTISPQDVKNRVAVAKASTWLTRSKRQTDTWVFRDANVTTVQQLPPGYRHMIGEARHLKISVTEEAVLERFAEKFRSHIYSLEALTIKVVVTWRRSIGERSRAERLQMRHEGDLCFLIVHRHLRQNLKSIAVHDASFVRRRYPSDSPVDRIYVRNTEFVNVSYPVLKRISIQHCAFDNVYNSSLFTGTGLLPPLLEYQCDPLHAALRGAPALEYLEVRAKLTDSGRAAWPGLGQRITLSQLKTAILPPPSIWSIDIIAPNLTTLRFVSPDSFYSYFYSRPEEARQAPLIPDIVDSPILLETLPRLEHVEFACFENDTTSRLEEWLSLLSSIKSLAIRSLRGNPWPAAPALSESPDQRAAVNVVQNLIDHPEWCPNLQELELQKCFATGNSLVQLVRTRKQSSHCVNLHRLSVQQSLSLTEKARKLLQKELPSFHLGYNCDPARGERREYWQDNFDEASTADAQS